ncbi:MAG: hypothetical protein BZ133_02885 [Methanosphaera sp. SHI613]|jgi:hypothetical protein|nr:MAG: hypothetical protein BZ133_02885 [Methanosphaera sp. SHI613]
MLKKYFMLMGFVLTIALFVSGVSAAGMQSAGYEDLIGYYGIDTPAGSSGYTYSIATDEGVFYMNDEQADTLGKHDYTLHKLVEYDLNKYSGMFTPDAVIWGSGGFNFVYDINHDRDTECFQIPNNQEFSFDYKSGQHVGYNTNAKVVTKLYDKDGNVMT